MVQHTLLMIGLQKYLIPQRIRNTFTMSTGDETIIAWKCKGVLDESIFFPHTAGNNSAPRLKWFSNSKIEVEFTGSCLKQTRQL